jgi:hypothetical protein
LAIFSKRGLEASRNKKKETHNSKKCITKGVITIIGAKIILANV